MTRALLLAAAIVVGALIAGRAPATPSVAAPAASCAPGRRCLPDVAWRDTNGVSHPRAALAGKVVVVNFWATWCHPCEQELPDLARIAIRYGDRVAVLGVLMDSPPPDPGALLNFLSDHEVSFPVIPATPELLRAFHEPANYPTTFVFDRDGVQRVWKIRPVTEAELARAIDALLEPRRS